MENERKHRKNSFQNITVVFIVECLAKVSRKLRQYIMLILIQILIDFFKIQTQIFQWELLCKFIIILESGTWYFSQAFTVNSGKICLSHHGMVSIPVYLEVAASKLCMIYIVGGNYCKLIKVRSAKRMWMFQRKTSLLQNGGHFHLKLSPKSVILSLIICSFGTHCKDFFEIFHNVKIFNRLFCFWEKLSLETTSALRGSIHLFQIIFP